MSGNNRKNAQYISVEGSSGEESSLPPPAFKPVALHSNKRPRTSQSNDGVEAPTGKRLRQDHGKSSTQSPQATGKPSGELLSKTRANPSNAQTTKTKQQQQQLLHTNGNTLPGGSTRPKTNGSTVKKATGSSGNTASKKASGPAKHQQSVLSQASNPSRDSVVEDYVKLEVIPKNLPKVPTLDRTQVEELEICLQLDRKNEDEWWREDWSGNLTFLTKEVSNPVTRRRKPAKVEMTQALWEWARLGGNNQKLACNLLAHVFHMRGTPATAKRVLAHAFHSLKADASFPLIDVVKRILYDPAILREDGWTTKRSPAPVGASGGPFHIGRRILWQGFEAAVIAYVHDPDYGDLWKAFWLDAFESFDLEAEELQESAKRWERKFRKPEPKKPEPKAKAEPAPSHVEAKVAEPKQKPVVSRTTSSARFAAAAKFSVEGIEHGVILATTYNVNARQGVFWPARVMHVSELDRSQTQGKRTSAKQRLNVVFLAPYWNSNVVSGGRNGNFSSMPLFDMDSLDVSDDTIQKYPFDPDKGLSMHRLRVAFRFTGLPKSAFTRFLDSHRLAMALKMYAVHELKKESTTTALPATAALFDTHHMAIQAAMFPSALLHLPFNYVLSHLPNQEKVGNSAQDDFTEPIIKLEEILKTMRAPFCWGQASESWSAEVTNNGKHHLSGNTSFSLRAGPIKPTSESEKGSLSVENFASRYLLNKLTALSATDLPSSELLDGFSKLAVRVSRFQVRSQPNSDEAKEKARSLMLECLRLKSFGEGVLVSDKGSIQGGLKTLLPEWKRACERAFQVVREDVSTDGYGHGVTFVLSDHRCNSHVTGSGCIERPVRLPAALKAAKQAGACSDPGLRLDLTIEDKYMAMADQVLPKAHGTHYIKRMKTNCAVLGQDASGIPLTEESNGEGGGDTTGSRGTYQAAVVGVAAALKAVDTIVGGGCINVFCATRPPGHHAGRSLHPMKAVSNGFCILNPAACAALYAATDRSSGGLGLMRVCVIDFDVHHGNGTQDILCSTYDPRFLYVSMHAGGAHINGAETEDADSDFHTVGSKRKEGIFPGRCGDSSPHKGVLNIPLGAKVTPPDVGNALITVVEPAVEEFSPDLIVLSAGFDAHKNDPLGMGGLAAQDFGHITEVACSLAHRLCSGRVMSILEGGYGVPCCRPQADLFIPPQPPAPSSQLTDSQVTNTQISIDSDKASTSLPTATTNNNNNNKSEVGIPSTTKIEIKRQQPSKLMDLGDDLPEDMDDQVTMGLQKKLERCHGEGFIDCIREHILSLRRNNSAS